MKGTIQEEAGKVNVMVESDRAAPPWAAAWRVLHRGGVAQGWLERRSFRSELGRRVASELVRRVCFQSLTLC
jgi:hypothetical protein